MKYIFLAVIFTACSSTNTKCEIHNKAVEVLAPAVVSGLQCTDAVAVKEWVSTQIEKVGLTCDVQAKGLICEKIVEVLVSNAKVGDILPDGLKSCAATNVKAAIAAAAKSACSGLPF